MQKKNVYLVGWFAVCLLFSSMPLFATAATKDPPSLDVMTLLMGLFGGLAIFLYGMERMSDALRAVAGNKMKEILAVLSKNRIMGVITGTIVTSVVQSSSVTTVLLVGFVSAGLMTLSQTIGIIFGANIGTTITAQIVAFKVTKYALIMIAIGFGMLFFSKKEKVKHYGYALMGLGMVFFGMGVMSGAMKPLRDFQPFLDLMQQMSNPVLGILVGAAFTALVQSSSATTGVVIVMAMQGLIGVEAGIALSFGANVGTCVTAGLASIGKEREAVRVFVVHTLFNVTGVLLILPFLSWFADFIVTVSPEAAAGLTGQDRLADVVPRQIANAHTVFNIGMALLFLPFTAQFAKIALKLVPDRKADEVHSSGPRYMQESLLNTPALALEATRHEFQRIGKRLETLLESVVSTTLQGSKEAVDQFHKTDDEVDSIYRQIIDYLRHISSQNLNEGQTEELTDFMTIANELESIGDVIEHNMLPLGHERISKNLQVSDETLALLNKLGSKVGKAFQSTLAAMEELDVHSAGKVVKMKSKINQLILEIEQHLAQRLTVDAEERLNTYALEMDVIDNLKRIFYHTKRIARVVAKISKNEESKMDTQSDLSV